MSKKVLSNRLRHFLCYFMRIFSQGNQKIIKELTEKLVESTADLVWIFVKGEFQFHACLDFNIMQRELY